MRERCGVLVRALLFMTILLLPAVSHAQLFGRVEVVDDVMVDHGTGTIWYRNLARFANMTYQQQYVEIEVLNSGKFNHCTSWHMATVLEVMMDLRGIFQDRSFESLSAVFYHTEKVSSSDPLAHIDENTENFLSGEQNYNWLGRYILWDVSGEENDLTRAMFGVIEMVPSQSDPMAALMTFSSLIREDFSHPSLGAWVCCRPQPPVFDPIEDKIVNEGNTLEFTIAATYPDFPLTPISYSAVMIIDGNETKRLPDGAHFDNDTQTFSWMPMINPLGQTGFGQAGVYAVKFSVRDSEFPFIRTDRIITITVNHVDRIETTYGDNVTIQPDGGTPGSAPVSITFDKVTEAGETRLALSDQLPETPGGFKVGYPATYVQIETKAVFSDNVTVCIDYTDIAFQGGSDNDLKLYHNHGGEWEDVTTYPIDTVNKRICGKVTSFSPFVVVEPHPTADAGDKLFISSEDQKHTVVQGSAAGPDVSKLTFRWLEGDHELTPWLPVTNGAAPLDLGSVTLSIGEHTLTLEVTDGFLSDADRVIIIVGNSAPHAVPSGGGVYPVNTDVELKGQVIDFDGDPLTYEWVENGSILFAGGISAVPVDIPVDLLPYVLSGLTPGVHVIILRVTDGINQPIDSSIKVVVDGTAPTLAPVANQTILWPANHQMIPIIIKANASDNSGLPVTLSAVVSSNEPIDGLGDGDTAPDWTEPEIEQETGTITLQLRSERSGRGNGRTYTITVTATDYSGNISKAAVKVIVPHDKGKK